MTGDRRGGVVPSPSDAQQVLRQLNVRLEGALHVRLPWGDVASACVVYIVCVNMSQHVRASAVGLARVSSNACDAAAERASSSRRPVIPTQKIIAIWILCRENTDGLS
jgi:hypothetical protein